MTCGIHKLKYENSSEPSLGNALYNEFQKEAKRIYAEVTGTSSFYAVETIPNSSVTQLTSTMLGDRLGLESALGKTAAYQQPATVNQAYAQPLTQQIGSINPSNKGLEYMAQVEDEEREQRLQEALGSGLEEQAYKESQHALPKVMYQPGAKKSEFRKLDIDIKRPEPSRVHQLFYKPEKEKQETYVIASDYSKTARMKKDLREAKEAAAKLKQKKVLVLTEPDKEERRLAA